MPDMLERVSVNYENLSKKFSETVKSYAKQYCSIYSIRLEMMRKILQDRISKKWGDEYAICKLHQLTDESSEKFVVICTLFKDQKLKPSVLKQLAETNHLVPQPIISHFTDESDVLFIEDELQRYQVAGNLSAEKLVTGITCALLGSNIGNGKFLVEDFVFADCRSQVERPLIDDDKYLVLLSGLDFMHIEKSSMNVQLFIHWVTGLIDADEASKIVRLIIAGNSIKTSADVVKPTISLTSRVAESSESIDAVRLFDSWLLHLCQIVDVDLMPGEHDPSNHILPQKPLHHCMFPNSAKYRSLSQVPNPYLCSLDGVKILGTSGQPVHDIMRYCEIQEPIEALESCLKWNHIAPTAPDTLGCFPFYERDPFIIEDCPHVMFAGNQDKFDTKIMTGEDGQQIRLICVPQFSKSFQVCLLNLKDLSCQPMLFSV